MKQAFYVLAAAASVFATLVHVVKGFWAWFSSGIVPTTGFFMWAILGLVLTLFFLIAYYRTRERHLRRQREENDRRIFRR